MSTHSRGKANVFWNFIAYFAAPVILCSGPSATQQSIIIFFYYLVAFVV